MPIQIATVNVVPAGLARYDGANAVVQLTDTPAYGAALPANPGGSSMKSVTGADLYVDTGTVMVTYDGTAPSATDGFPITGTESYRNMARTDLAAMKLYIPTGTKLYTRYFWGSM